jgi:hypothetical protein
MPDVNRQYLVMPDLIRHSAVMPDVIRHSAVMPDLIRHPPSSSSSGEKKMDPGSSPG